tara:strand:+ start:147 stop:1316 length:1170 start_codon:yes stop_codon:yes gene_type:complete
MGNDISMKEYSSYIFKRSKPEVSSKPIRIIDLFSGIGGFHIGLEHAAKENNLKIEAHFSSDIDAHACEVYENNFTIKPFGDVQDIDSSAAKGGDLICGGFPCQPFSNSGLKKGLNDSRGNLYEHIDRFIRHGTPKAFLLENVSGILSNGKGHKRISRLHSEGHAKTIGATMQHLEERLESLSNYSVSWALLDSSHFGSPQVRRRVFIVGIHKDLNHKDFAFPTGSNQLNTMRTLIDFQAVASYALNPNQQDNIRKDMIEKHRPTYRNGMRRVGQAYHCPGGNVGQAYHIDGLVPTLTVVWTRFLPLYFPTELEVTPNDPYQEIYDPGSYYGQGKIRRATPRECLRLQGFPDDFIINKNEAQTYREVGNAVHCSVVNEIGRNLLPILASS